MTLTRLDLPGVESPVYLRPNTQDGQSWVDIAQGRYHVPPDWMPPPETVLDLGANIGLAAIHYRALWPTAEILGVEMDAGNVAMAQRNAEGIEIVHAAVAADGGSGHYDSSGASNAFRLGTGSTPVSLVTMPELVARMGGRVDFCKIDIEGSEWHLLEHAASWAPDVRALLVELHAPTGDWPTSYEAEDAEVLLTAVGYHVNRHWRHPKAYFAWR